MREEALRSLEPAARLVLGALAVVAPASLSVEELGEITEVSDAQLALLTDLEGRGLVVREKEDRYSLAPEEQRPLKRLLASLDTVDRVLRGFIDIAEDGRLTLDDLDAVLELTRIAAATGRWAELLRLVNAAETTLSVTRRVEEWREILERRGGAKQMLDRLDSVGGGVSVPLAAALAAAAAAVALGAGYLVGNQSSDGGTVTKAAKTVTKTRAAETVTATRAAETVTATTTVVTDTTTVVTTTVVSPQ